MSRQETCVRCGAALPAEAVGGHCPHCLVNVALAPAAERARTDRLGPLPRRFGGYELLEEIARGGMGVVYRARQLNLKRIVALKMILAGEFAGAQAQRRFQQEAESAARLQHPNIVTIHDVGEGEGQAYFTMDFIEGHTLVEAVRDQPLPARKAGSLVKVIADAVHYAHQRGILHRDLKPSNILIDPFEQPHITDFGLARSLVSDSEPSTLNLTLTGQALGSPGYISPEQAFGKHAEVGPASDVYSLGAILYHLLTGRAPFQGESVHDVLLQVKSAEPVPPRRLNPSAPLDLETICLKCLEKDPARRYASAAALADELGKFLRDEPIQARPVGAAAKLWKWCRRRPAVAALGASVLLLMIAVAIGSTVAAWRIDVARRAEHTEQQKAAAANRDLRATVALLELERAEDLFRANDAVAGVAHLAAILRNDPSNHISASRLISALIHRNWALPASPPLRHARTVETARFSPDGRYVLTTMKEGRRMQGHYIALSQSDTRPVSDPKDNVAHIWDSNTGMLVAKLEHGDLIYSARYSPDGQRIVTASADGSARIWNATNGEAMSPPLRHTGKVFRVEFSADNRSIVTASADRTAAIWHATNGELKQTLGPHSTAVRLAHFSPDVRHVATVSENGTIRVWNADSGKQLFEFWGHRHQVNALAFSSDSRKIIAACPNGIAWLLELDSDARLLRTTSLPHGKLPLWHATFSPDNRLVLTTSEDTTARLWNATNGFPISLPLRHEGGVVFGSFSSDGERIVTTSSDGSARIWESQSRVMFCPPLRHGEPVRFADFTADGRRLVTSSVDDTAQIWAIGPRLAVPLELRHAAGGTTVKFSSRGEFLLTASVDKTARLWDALNGKSLGEPIQHTSAVVRGDVSADGELLLTACADGTAQVWDRATRRMIAGPIRHAGVVRAALFSPDGKSFATASADGMARVWNARTGEAITPVLAHNGDVRFACFSPDGSLLVAGAEDKTARIWNAQTGEPAAAPLQHDHHVLWAEFSFDSRRVVTASADNTARVWDARTGRPVTPPLVHERIVAMAAFSPDGKRVATASLDWTARLWNAETGEALTPPLQHNSSLTHVRFSPDGRRILTGGWSSEVRMWDAQTGRPLMEWLYTGGRTMNLCFDSTGQRIAVANESPSARVWHLPEAPLPVPQLFIAFAEAVAGRRLSPRGNVELLPRGELEQRAREFSRLPTDDFYRRLTEWFLADPGQRTGRPF